MKRLWIAGAVAGAALALLSAGPAAGDKSRFDKVVDQLLAEPYQPDYVPNGNDSAFPGAVANTHPAQDYTTGSVPGNPDHPDWPSTFEDVVVTSGDGAPLFGKLALRPGKHPGIVVVHGFNTNAKESVIRWAAMLYANGYNVLAADQRDFKAEHTSDPTYRTKWPQTFGWKEAEDVLAHGRFLAAQKGVTSVGVVGYSLGGQDTVLALALDREKVFAAGLNFSGPANQNAQIYSTAAPPGCAPPLCTYPTTNALVLLVVPPYSYTNACRVLDDASRIYGTTNEFILAQESAYRAQLRVKVPLLSIYADDDSLVQSFQARMMNAYDDSKARRTVLLSRGLHAYFNDRWWQQRATLLYFKALIAEKDKTITTNPTVNQSAGGTPAAQQLVDLGTTTRAQADAMVGPVVCPSR